ncbi:MAG TPA: 50S ribosomal protein L6 [Stellaceae bacterium]|nr:50S ribosomal protein L6 [Stellaceae bacterium]
MSRIGKNPVTLPQGVTVQIGGASVAVKGRLGNLTIPLSAEVDAKVADGRFVVSPRNETKRARMLWGTTRALVNNMVRGVSQGFTRSLEINGVGYRAAVQGKNLVLQLGYSHDINFPIPDDVKITCEKPTAITVTGADKQRVGQVAAVIRGFRLPEPYKGKGIKYAEEHVRRKEGKKK